MPINYNDYEVILEELHENLDRQRIDSNLKISICLIQLEVIWKFHYFNYQLLHLITEWREFKVFFKVHTPWP